MEEEKDLKLEIILKTILLGILTIVISISILFFIGVSRVNADSLYGTYAYSYYPNGNQSGSKTCNEIPCELTPSKSGSIYTNNSFLIRVHTGYNASWTYQTGLSYKVVYTYYNYTLNLDTSNIKVYYVNSGGTRTRIYNECSTTSNQSVRKIKIGSLEGTEKTFDINTYCSNMEVTSDQTDWEIEIPIASVQGTGAYGAMNLQVWRFTKSQVQKSTLDTDKITDNADKNADKIINNNNFNTQSIINSVDTNINDLKDIFNNNNQELIEANANNTEQITTTIKDAFTNCDDYNISLTNGSPYTKQGAYLDQNGNYIENVGWNVSEYYGVNANSTYKITFIASSGSSPSYCLYNKNKEKISCSKYNSVSEINVTPTQEGYIRVSYNIHNSITKITNVQGQYCYNRLDAEWEKDNPDESAEEELEGYENELADYMIDDSDINNLNFEIDTTSSQVIWTIFTNIVQSNQILFTTILTILLLGIVKLILAR